MEMKHSRAIQISLILVILLVDGCFPPPEFPDTPVIEYTSLRYIDYLNSEQSTEVSDSLILNFDFEDGDGDVGLSEEGNYPFHQYDLVLDSRNRLVTISDTSAAPPFFRVDPLGQRYYFSETDNRPAFSECDYIIGAAHDDGLQNDTIFKVDNEFYSNFHIDFFRKRGGQYEKILFSSAIGGVSCDVVNFNGRIPVFDDALQGKPMSGNITYSLFSRGFQIVLARDTFKIDFYLYDRALNKSNVASSPDLLLSNITVERTF